MTKICRFGIIGCSSIAERRTIPAIFNSKNSKLEIIGSRDVNKARKVANRFHIKKFGKYEQVLKEKNVDAVYISLPPRIQFEWIIKAAKAKKHIICEKSATTSLRNAKKIILECKKNHVRIIESFPYKIHPQNVKVKKIISQKSFGKIFSLDLTFGFKVDKKESSFRLDKNLGGGVLNDIGCYGISMSRFLFKEDPTHIFCRLFYDKKLKIDTAGFLQMDFPQNKIVLMKFSYENNFQSKMEIWSENGFLSLEKPFNKKSHEVSKISYSINDAKKLLKISKADQFEKMITEFSKMTFLTSVNKINENELLNQAKIMDLARLSDKQNRKIRI